MMLSSCYFECFQKIKHLYFIDQTSFILALLELEKGRPSSLTGLYLLTSPSLRISFLK